MRRVSVVFHLFDFCLSWHKIKLFYEKNVVLKELKQFKPLYMVKVEQCFKQWLWIQGFYPLLFSTSHNTLIPNFELI